MFVENIPVIKNLHILKTESCYNAKPLAYEKKKISTDF